jgi:hypothetical protein
MRRLFVTLVTAGLLGWMVAGAEAHVALSAKLDAAQEVPAPAGVGGSAGGAITFEFTDEDGKLAYTASVSGLTGNPIAGHLHLGAPGTAGDIKIGLPTAALPKNDGVPVSGSVQLDTATAQLLYQGLLYVNFHTVANLSGEIRGQVLADPGACSCKTAASPGKFAACVKKEIKKLAKDKRTAEAAKSLKRNAALTTCGSKKTKQPKKTVACCLLLTPLESAADTNIANGYACSAQKESRCAKLGGQSLGAGSSCVPTNPCRFPASASGAFVD